jgi:hypothetical protein
MKPRLFPIFALLMLMGLSVAGAATAEAAAPQTAPAVDASSAPASFLCSLSTSTSAPEVAGLNPAPVLKTGATCGTCSLSPCVGVPSGTTCVVGTRRGTCQSPLGDLCPGTVTLKCQCWSGPLP